MKGYSLVSSILGRPWAIQREWAEANLHLVTRVLKGEQIGSFEDGGEDPDDEDPHQPLCLNIQAGAVNAQSYRAFSDAPKDSIAMIPVIGPIAKYYNCGIPGSTDMTAWIKEAEESPNIKSILIKLDTPGGQVDGLANLRQAIKECEKKVVAYVDDGICASAGMRIAAACDEIVLSQESDRVGSIGVFSTIYDFREYYEKEGIKIHEIYAPQSVDKNKPYKEAIENKYELVEKELTYLADQFINDVKEDRGSKLNLEKENPFTGKMYRAKEAIELGLADRIGSYEDAIIACMQSGETTTDSTINSTDKTTMKFGNKFPTLSSQKGKKADDVTEEDIQAVNSELESQGITGVSVFSSSFQAEAEKLEEEATTAKADLKKAEDRAAKAEKALQDEKDAHEKTQGELQTLKDKVPSESKAKPEINEDPKQEENENEFLSEADEKLARMKKDSGLGQ